MSFKVGDLVRTTRTIKVGVHKEVISYMGIVWEYIEDKTLNNGLYRVRILRATNEFTDHFLGGFDAAGHSLKYMTENKDDMAEVG